MCVCGCVCVYECVCVRARDFLHLEGAQGGMLSGGGGASLYQELPASGSLSLGAAV